MIEIRHIEIDHEQYNPNEVIQEHCEMVSKEFRMRLEDTIGYTGVQLDGLKQSCRDQETNLGNFVADLMRTQYDSDIAFVNSGALKMDKKIEPG